MLLVNFYVVSTLMWITLLLLSPVFVECQDRCELKPAECGSPKVSPNILSRLRIVGGSEAVPHSWPWQLSLKINTMGFEFRHNCGASLISNCYAVTAAHCVHGQKASAIQLVAGLHDRETDAGQVRNVVKITVHPNYKAINSLWDYDIALLKVEKPFDFSRNVSAVCLPETMPLDGEEGAATGWGYTVQGGYLATVLNQVDMPVIAANSCKGYYSQLGDIFQRRFCAGLPKTGGKDTCQGDSGGPFVTRSATNLFQLTGVTSVGSGCADVNKPGIYTNVFMFKNWIVNSMNDCGVRGDVNKKPGWLVKLRSTMNELQCDAVAINSNTILATKKCVYDAAPLLQTKQLRVNSNGVDYEVASFKCNVTANANACLLKTNASMWIMPVCMPTGQAKSNNDCVVGGSKHDEIKIVVRPCTRQPKNLCLIYDSQNVTSCVWEHASYVTCASSNGRQVLYALMMDACREAGTLSKLFNVFNNMRWMMESV